MPDKPPAPQAQIWNRPGGGQPSHPAPSPAPVKLTTAGPLKGADTIAVTRDGVTIPVPLSVLATYFKGGHG